MIPSIIRFTICGCDGPFRAYDTVVYFPLMLMTAIMTFPVRLLSRAMACESHVSWQQ